MQIDSSEGIRSICIGPIGGYSNIRAKLLTADAYSFVLDHSCRIIRSFGHNEQRTPATNTNLKWYRAVAAHLVLAKFTLNVLAD